MILLSLRQQQQQHEELILLLTCRNNVRNSILINLATPSKSISATIRNATTRSPKLYPPKRLQLQVLWNKQQWYWYNLIDWLQGMILRFDRKLKDAIDTQQQRCKTSKQNRWSAQRRNHMEQWRKRKTTDEEMNVAVSLWNVSTISQILMEYFIRENGFWTVDWRHIHYWDEASFVYMDSDYLANSHNWGTYFVNAIDTQGIIGDTIDSQQSWGRRRWSDPLDTQGIIGDTFDTHHAINTQQQSCRWKCMLDLPDTQGVDHIIDVQYSIILWEMRAEALVGSTWYSTDRDSIDSREIVWDLIVIWYSTSLQEVLSEALIIFIQYSTMVRDTISWFIER